MTAATFRESYGARSRVLLAPTFADALADPLLTVLATEQGDRPREAT